MRNLLEVFTEEHSGWESNFYQHECQFDSLPLCHYATARIVITTRIIREFVPREDRGSNSVTGTMFILCCCNLWYFL